MDVTLVARNKDRRLFISVELPWSAENAVQQFGRVHRASQVCEPKFIILKTNLQGETRFVSIISKRLKMMGTLL